MTTNHVTGSWHTSWQKCLSCEMTNFVFLEISRFLDRQLFVALLLARCHPIALSVISDVAPFQSCFILCLSNVDKKTVSYWLTITLARVIIIDRAGSLIGWLDLGFWSVVLVFTYCLLYTEWQHVIGWFYQVFISNIKSRVAFLRSLLHSFHYSYHSKWAAGWYCFSLLRLSVKVKGHCRSKRRPFILNLDLLNSRMKRIFLELRNIFFFSLFAPWLVLVFILSFLLKTIISIWNEKKTIKINIKNQHFRSISNSKCEPGIHTSYVN